MNKIRFPSAFFKKFQMLLGMFALFGLFSSHCSAAPPPFQLLHSFKIGHPFSQLIEDPAGNRYGTLADKDRQGLGGGDYGLGAVFKFDASGNYSILYSFQGSDGENPIAGLILGKDGFLYGTTSYGGKFDAGTIYKMDISGSVPTLTVLHHFDGISGANPLGSLIQGKDGIIYGTTESGGSYGYGTVFRFDITGLTILHSFDSTMGARPQAGLIQGMDGNLYGTTYYGGSNSIVAGTIFRLNISGMKPVYTVLHEFYTTTTGFNPEGSHPRGLLVQGHDGKLYGTTENGGSSIDGVIFQLDISGIMPVYKVLHYFDYPYGSMPYAGLTEGSDGKFYGTTSNGGGAYGGGIFGTIFRLDTSGSIPIHTVLHSFDCAFTGCDPEANLIQGKDGYMYGTAAYQDFSYGAVFRIGYLALPTVTTLSSNLNPSYFGQPVTFTATVSGDNPTRTVTFLDGIKVLGSRPVDSGAATLTVNSFDPGGHNIIARYDGDNNNYGSLSATTQVVKPLPVAGNDTFKLDHMGLGSVTEAAPGVLGNDSDAEGRVLTVVGTTASSPKIITLTNPKGIVSGGKVALYADGHFDYTPANIGFNGTRSFTYQATNGKANSDPATVTLVIKRAPYAGNDSSTTSQGKPVTINLIANDVAYKATINPSAITIVSPPENGNATVNPNGIVVYKPNANFGGTDIFTYTVNDSTGATSNIATVTVYVPKAVADNYKVTATTGASQKTSKNAETGVLANDQPIELKGRTVRVVGDITRTGGTGTATIGSLTLNANGSFNFTLTAPASASTAGLKKDSKRGTYKFSYKETLNGVTTAPTTTTIEVQ